MRSGVHLVDTGYTTTDCRVQVVFAAFVCVSMLGDVSKSGSRPEGSQAQTPVY